MQLSLGLLGIFWIPAYGNALKCVLGTIVRDGNIVDESEQKDLIDGYIESPFCYFSMHTENCSVNWFRIEGLGAVKAQTYRCYQSNTSAVFCGCDDQDFCNIRLYGLASLLRSFEALTDVDCYNKLLTKILPKDDEGDTTTEYIKKKWFQWWCYLLFAIGGVNIVGCSLHFGDAFLVYMRERKKKNEEKRSLEMDRMTKQRSNSRQYHNLWPLEETDREKKEICAVGHSGMNLKKNEKT